MAATEYARFAPVAVVEHFATYYSVPATDGTLVGRRAGTSWETLATLPIGLAARP